MLAERWKRKVIFNQSMLKYSVVIVDSQVFIFCLYNCERNGIEMMARVRTLNKIKKKNFKKNFFYIFFLVFVIFYYLFNFVFIYFDF